VAPLGLITLASSWGGEDVSLLDLNTVPNPLASLERNLESRKPGLIGFSLRNADTTSPEDPFSYVPAFLAQMRLTAARAQGAEIWVGGAGFSLFAGDLLDALPRGVKGLTGAAVPGMPAPRWDLVDMERYLPFQKNLSIGIEVSQGCRLRCGYCVYPFLSGYEARDKPPAEIAFEAARLSSMGVRHVFLCAPVLNHSPGSGEEAALAVSASGITWEAYHSPLGFSESYARRIGALGCTGVSFSPDGGSSGDMKRLGKDFGPEQTIAAIRAASVAGLNVSINMFPYFPWSTPVSMIMAFLTGARWGIAAGRNLSRLRFSAVRRISGGMFGPGRPAMETEIPVTEFVLPPAAWMPLFHMLRKALGKRLRRS
jgi:hypothetical protein